MSARTAALIGLPVLVLAVAFVVLNPQPRAVESVSRSIQAALVVPKGAGACQEGVDVPPGTGAVELTVSTAGKEGGRLPVVIFKDDGFDVARGTVPAGYSDQPVRARLGELPRGVDGVVVCISNPEGPEIALLGAPLTRQTTSQGWLDDLGGESGPPAKVLRAPRRADQPNERIRMEWQFGSERSHASYAGTVGERAALVKAPFLGSALMWIALALTAVAALGAIALVAREAGRE